MITFMHSCCLAINKLHQNYNSISKILNDLPGADIVIKTLNLNLLHFCWYQYSKSIRLLYRIILAPWEWICNNLNLFLMWLQLIFARESTISTTHMLCAILSYKRNIKFLTAMQTIFPVTSTYITYGSDNYISSHV